MSCDIGVLRGFVADFDEAWRDLISKREVLRRAIGDALTAEFGTAGLGPQSRAWVLPGMQVSVDFDQGEAGAWCADAHVGASVCTEARADTPRAAIEAALAALATTHPDKAAALRLAVTPTEAP